VKILFCANDDLSDSSGITRYIDFMGRSLIEHGHEPLIVGYARYGTSTLTTPADLRPFKGHAVAKLRTAFATVVRAVRDRYPVVALTQLAAPLNAPLSLVLRVAGKKLLYVCMDPPPETYPEVFPDSKMVRIAVPLLGVSEGIIDRCCAATFSVSPGVDRIMRARGWRGRIRRFYNVHGTAVGASPVDTPSPFDASWENDPVVVYVGHLQPGFRGIEEQVDAVAAARAHGARVRLAVVGRGDGAFVRARAAALGIEDSVRIVPTMSPAELSQFLMHCDAAVFASLSFALPSKVFECLAHGLRLFAIAGETDVNELLGDLVEPYDGTPVGLAAAFEGCAKRTLAEKQAAASAVARKLSSFRSESVDALLDEVARLAPATLAPAAR
jgi:glycosyltransferase involved in cell wall biosynthesis